MSLPLRPRVMVNGVQRMRTYHYFWCRHCRRAVRIRGAVPPPASCPRCLTELRHELDFTRTRLFDDLAGMEPNLSGQILQSVAALFYPPPLPPRRRDSFSHRRTRWESETEDGPDSSRSWIVLNFDGSRRPDAGPYHHGGGNPEEAAADVVDDAGGFGPNDPLQEIMAQQQQQQGELAGGPPPAFPAAIDALPVETVTERHLREDPQCAVCKEEYEVGGEVRMMPCAHFYHSDCIVPWLRIHNACPICRRELPFPTGGDVRGTGDDGGGGMNREWSRLLSSVWPFRLFSNWGDSGSHGATDDVGFRWWHSWLIL